MFGSISTPIGGKHGIVSTFHTEIDTLGPPQRPFPSGSVDKTTTSKNGLYCKRYFTIKTVWKVVIFPHVPKEIASEVVPKCAFPYEHSSNSMFSRHAFAEEEHGREGFIGVG